jgi:hypothetical protein
MGKWIQLHDADMTVGYTGGWCLSYVQNAFGTDHPFPSAIDSWNGNVGNGNHAGEIPALGMTVPVYFSLGDVPAGHVAIRLDDGFVASSTQAGVHPRPYLHPNLDDLIALYGKYNNGCNFLGWSEYVGNVKVVGWSDSHQETVPTVIAFSTITLDDETLALGQTGVRQIGTTGEHTQVYLVHTVDGVEQSRDLLSDNVVSPVAQVNTIGTFVPPIIPPVVVPDPIVVIDPIVPIVPVVPAKPISNENDIIKIIARIVLMFIAIIKSKLNKK